MKRILAAITCGWAMVPEQVLTCLEEAKGQLTSAKVI